MKQPPTIGSAVILGIILFSMALIWFGKKAQTLLPSQAFFYPIAPPMPAVVDETMPQILANLDSVLKTNAPQVLAILQPGISSDRISQLEEQYHAQVPDDIAAIYEWHDGIRANTNYYADLPNTGTFADFIPGHHFNSLEDMLEENRETKEVASGIKNPKERALYQSMAGHRDNWYRLLADSEGDGYFFDPTRKSTDGAVFSTVTEEGYFLFFPSPKNVMAGIARCYQQGAYRVKLGSPKLQLDEDSDQSAKIWKEFGASNQQEQ